MDIHQAGDSPHEVFHISAEKSGSQTRPRVPASHKSEVAFCAPSSSEDLLWDVQDLVFPLSIMEKCV